MDCIHQRAYDALMECDVDLKVAKVKQLAQDWSADLISVECEPFEPISVVDPGRPTLPELVLPKNLPKRRLGSKEGQAALMHSIAHIEFNAINLALDALYRFQGLPKEYYGDWLRVCTEEAYHFQMVREHLATLGYEYGDFPAHNGLWEMTFKTSHDPLVRMALVPRTLEARGLDVSPPMMKKLRAVGDHRGVEILKILLHDEIGHVWVGNRWFHYLCEQRGVRYFDVFQELVDEYLTGQLKGPFNYEARRQAGFTEEELEWLKNWE